MKPNRRAAAALLLGIAAHAFPGCSLVSGHSAPDWAWFDVTGRPTGGIPASLGFYAGVAVLTPVEFVLSGLLPAPVDDPVSRAPGDAVGTAAGLVLGAPFHLVALPFGGGGAEAAAEVDAGPR